MYFTNFGYSWTRRFVNCFYCLIVSAEYTAIRDSFMRSAQGYLIVYDITNKITFEEVNECVEHVLKVRDCERFPIVIVGNKCDLENERKVNINSAQMYITNYSHVPHCETSAKNR